MRWLPALTKYVAGRPQHIPNPSNRHRKGSSEAVPYSTCLRRPHPFHRGMCREGKRRLLHTRLPKHARPTRSGPYLHIIVRPANKDSTRLAGMCACGHVCCGGLPCRARTYGQDMHRCGRPFWNWGRRVLYVWGACQSCVWGIFRVQTAAAGRKDGDCARGCSLSYEVIKWSSLFGGGFISHNWDIGIVKCVIRVIVYDQDL